jgi:hypothetical protein
MDGVKKVLITPEQTKQYITARVSAQLHKEYPMLPPGKVARLAYSLSRKALKSIPGGRIFLALKPANRWERLKEGSFPTWLKRFFPVRYEEADAE